MKSINWAISLFILPISLMASKAQKVSQSDNRNLGRVFYGTEFEENKESSKTFGEALEIIQDIKTTLVDARKSGSQCYLLRAIGSNGLWKESCSRCGSQLDTSVIIYLHL